MSFKRSCLAVGVILLVFSVGLVCANAQTPGVGKHFGRLPDGRAYRLDERGNRLIDQIAELEVTVDDLRRQSRALEDELNDKERIIQRLNSGKEVCSSNAVLEKDVISGTEVRSGTLPRVPQHGETPDCNDLVSTLYLKLARSDRMLKEEQAKSVSPTIVGTAAKCDYQSPENPLWDQVARLQEALMAGPSKESVEKETALRKKEHRLRLSESERRQDLEQDLAFLRKKNAEMDKSLSLTKKELSFAEDQIDSSKEQIAEIKEQLEESKVELAKAVGSANARARMKAPKRVKAVSKSAPAPRPRVDTIALKAARTSFTKEIKTIQSKIGQRKSLLDKSKKRRLAVSIQVQPLVTSRGVSLDKLRGEVTRLNHSSNIAGIRRGLREIQGVLDDDIAVLTRLLRS